MRNDKIRLVDQLLQRVSNLHFQMKNREQEEHTN